MIDLGSRAKRLTNRLLANWNKGVYSEWETRWYLCDRGFRLNDRCYEFFCHPYNCGWPPWRMTERAVELAVADHWLARRGTETVVEIGAVTPYYWPGRVREVIDPGDEHPLVTDRSSIFDVDLTGRAVLAISTIEHIGVAEYGQTADPPKAGEALRKILDEADALLITVPLGYNPTVDDLLLGSRADWPDDVRVGYLVRGTMGNDWRQVGVAEASRATYGPRRYDDPGAWANGVAILERA